MLIRKSKSDALEEISETDTPNDEYDNLVNAHIKAAAECIPTKQRAKLWIHWRYQRLEKSVQT